MADILGLVRDFHLNNKRIGETQNELIFGDFAWSKKAKTNYAAGVPVVRLPDRKDLLAFLNGETNSAPGIDRAAPVAISLSRPVAKQGGSFVLAVASTVCLNNPFIHPN
ncbi:unnamed protein product [Protopolystoma xenopodis]|uniref:Paf1 complex subunit Cdc73 N-terminal domain-containing protein n=1 Tax=Protopolystoma xenopodis TaxID=117903 RepID=A0A448WMU9_9PLAT|nr:unnamed protein product [Protopolystoma xenopodis]